MSWAINKVSWACKALITPVSISDLKLDTFFRFHLFSLVEPAVQAYAWFKMDGEVRQDYMSEMGPKSKPYFHRPVFWDLRENRIGIQVTLHIEKLKREQQAKSDRKPTLVWPVSRTFTYTGMNQG